MVWDVGAVREPPLRFIAQYLPGLCTGNDAGTLSSTREHLKGEKVRKDIAKNGDKTAEGHASHKSQLAGKAEVEGMKKR